jgi:hypothetical protein
MPLEFTTDNRATAIAEARVVLGLTVDTLCVAHGATESINGLEVAAAP